MVGRGISYGGLPFLQQFRYRLTATRTDSYGFPKPLQAHIAKIRTVNFNAEGRIISHDIGNVYPLSNARYVAKGSASNLVIPLLEETLYLHSVGEAKPNETVHGEIEKEFKWIYEMLKILAEINDALPFDDFDPFLILLKSPLGGHPLIKLYYNLYANLKHGVDRGRIAHQHENVMALQKLAREIRSMRGANSSPPVSIISGMGTGVIDTAEEQGEWVPLGGSNSPQADCRAQASDMFESGRNNLADVNPALEKAITEDVNVHQSLASNGTVRFATAGLNLTGEPHEIYLDQARVLMEEVKAWEEASAKLNEPKQESQGRGLLHVHTDWSNVMVEDTS